MRCALGVALIAMSAQAQASDCEGGILDAGTDGMNVLVYELCPERLTVGFRSSDVIEEISCGPDGEIRLWLRAANDRCEGRPESDHGRDYELLEPLRGVGRAAADAVRQLLTCRGGTINRATIVVPEARDAILETRIGDTTYEQLSRRFISQCIAWPSL
ncbi:MAG: hypothetical protein Q8K93_02435 [Reyranella sp.]|uniref:hypothetical protein n=1 Tax=Reyranella sp. TaxID=1929291 RepID=UPI00272F61FC|nr:hypothetical protein [Reyranella sp.]MDP1961039.1 hypothetical protein [Reyranella sp.]MDP2372152.1 hypothetical protein [Reyranella sp.]